jgi:hypothetical protein
MADVVALKWSVMIFAGMMRNWSPYAAMTKAHALM